MAMIFNDNNSLEKEETIYDIIFYKGFNQLINFLYGFQEIGDI